MTATHGTTPHRTTHRTTHPTPDLFALSDIKGPVLRPGEDGYADEVTGFNLAALHTPDVVVGATGVDDIVAALRWASATRTPVAVQATGHGANYPIDSGLLITTTRMTDVEIDPTTRTATASASTRNGATSSTPQPPTASPPSPAPPQTQASSATPSAAASPSSAAPTDTPPTWSAPSRSSPRTAPSTR